MTGHDSLSLVRPIWMAQFAEQSFHTQPTVTRSHQGSDESVSHSPPLSPSLSLSSLRPLRTFSLWKLNTIRTLGVAVFTHHMRTVTFPQLWQRARVSLCLLPGASICIVFVLEDQGKGCRFKGHWDFSVLATWEERAGLCSENVRYRKQKFMWSVSVLCWVSEGFTSSVLLWILDYCCLSYLNSCRGKDGWYFPG